MRRIVPILLLLAACLPGLTPLLAARTRAQASLPACCRANGKHHCTMTIASAAPGTTNPTLTARPDPCPFGPAIPAPTHLNPLHPPTAPTLLAALRTQPAIIAQAETTRRTAQLRTRHKRGPPATFLL